MGLKKDKQPIELIEFEQEKSKAPTTDKNWSPYRDDKSATHKTVNGKGIVGKLIK